MSKKQLNTFIAKVVASHIRKAASAPRLVGREAHLFSIKAHNSRDSLMHEVAAEFHGKVCEYYTSMSSRPGDAGDVLAIEHAEYERSHQDFAERVFGRD